MYKEKLIPIGNNRPGKKTGKIQGIVIHYVGNAGSTALGNRNYFITNTRGASAHDIVDLNGGILHIIPYDEIAYHVGAKQYTDIGNYFGYPNAHLIGIELCHPDETAMPTIQTRQAAIALCADLCVQYNFNPLVDLYLHNDITGKYCHKYYCDYPEKWLEFREDVQKKIYAKVDG